MNNGPLIFLGIFFMLASSWCGLVFIPEMQFGGQQAVKIESTGEIYPGAKPGLAEKGELV